jgi:hypothetical protein
MGCTKKSQNAGFLANILSPPRAPCPLSKYYTDEVGFMELVSSLSTDADSMGKAFLESAPTLAEYCRGESRK